MAGLCFHQSVSRDPRRQQISRFSLWIVLILLFLGLSAHSQAPAQARHVPDNFALDQIAFVHGAAGPFAVAGYRIGEKALRELNLPRESFALEVIHKTPNDVQWSCIADGVQVSTGASVGQPNLKLVEVSVGREIRGRERWRTAPSP